ncbi:MAG: UvrD-helicase domain-containing protein, partial [Coriobacteriia bacterium]|nr:UvrD-helicase domain-containing protein [Coriobacteriia bacterium]
YDAVDFDDMVYRVYQAFSSGESAPEAYDLVLIDEYQDFNRLEAGFIGHLGTSSPILIAGDDDQALYARLRASSCEYIRLLHADDEYEVFELPFCLRCPEVVVEAVGDVIQNAQALGKLQGRIPKPYRYFPPAKGADSALYPRIRVVKTSVQRDGAANYMGKYIERAISGIPVEEIEQANSQGYPYALVIASDPYRRQVVAHLRQAGFLVDTKRDDRESLSRERGLALLKEHPEANLGWRIMLELDSPDFLQEAIGKTAGADVALVDVVPSEYRDRVLREVEAYAPPDSGDHEAPVHEPDPGRRVMVTSYEGAKGLSAQHVFLAGLHNGDMPSHPDDIQDLEICRFIVGLTRTRKSCTLIY